MTDRWIPLEGDTTGYPTLGHHAIRWMEKYLATPDRIEYEPLVLTEEQKDFVRRWFALDPVTGAYQFKRGVFSRPKGSGKSPIMAAVGACTALAKIKFSHWNEHGQPVGKAISEFHTPLVQFAAVNEDQTSNAFGPLIEMLTLNPLILDQYPGLEPMGTYVQLPGGGAIEPITANAVTKEGQRPDLAICDQTESWLPGNGGVKLHKVLRRNASKIGGRTIELPNAPEHGMESVAELTMKLNADIENGKVRTDPILYDHREAPADIDIYDDKAVLEGLAYVYGDSAKIAGGWVDLDPIAAEFRDPMNSIDELQRYYLNQQTETSDAWLKPNEVKAATDDLLVLKPGDTITLGFDGSKGRQKGKADSTALIAIRLEDMACFQIKVWEQPENERRWSVDEHEVDEVVRETFELYNVIGFYCDPSGWTEWMTRWESDLGRKLRVKASPTSKIQAWPNGNSSQVVSWLEKLHGAISQGEVSLADDYEMKKHLINARRKNSRAGVLIYKAYPMSPDKIDAAYALMLAYRAAIEARARNIGRKRVAKSQKAVIMSW